MRAVRATGNRSTELKLIALFRAAHITGWRRKVRLFGRPDFVFSSLRVAVFVDGCFWHGCPRHLRSPASNVDYWAKKIARNRSRDVLVSRQLRREGWRVIRIWEHELRQPDRLRRRLIRVLKKDRD